MDWIIHFHLISAIAWIGGSIFMFVLGVTLKDKNKQTQVYPNIGPIFGYFEMTALFFLILTGILMINNNGLITILFTNEHNFIIDTLREKLYIVIILTILSFIHFYIALKTNNIKRTKLQNIISRASSMLIFFLNLFILHYAIVLRDAL